MSETEVRRHFMQKMKKVQNCAETLKSLLPQGFSPSVGIVLGTGLGSLSASLQDALIIPYAALPGFPESTVASHAGHFSAGFLSGVPVLVQEGRCHLYEGRTPDEACMGVRVMGTLGIKKLIVTNAAGSVNPLFPAGSLMLMEDHINGTGQSPLAGPNVEEWGVRFPDMSRAYDQEFLRIMAEEALSLGIRLERGVYLCTLGPQLETRAETRAFRTLGADAVGMSTVLEVIAARHMGMRVLGVSCLTNQNLPDCMAEASIEEIIAVAGKAGKQLETLLLAALPELDR